MDDRICPAFDASTHRPTDGWVERARDDGSPYFEQVVEPIPLEEIAATLKQSVADAVQRHLDATVAARNYASAAAAVSYVGDPNPVWDAEARAVRAWRSAVWQACFAALDEVLAGERAPLTPEEMVAALPPFVWPA